MNRVTGGGPPAEIWRAFMAASLPRLNVQPIPGGPAPPAPASDAIGDILSGANPGESAARPPSGPPASAAPPDDDDGLLLHDRSIRDAIGVRGFISPPSVNRSNRKEITLFANGRWVQDIRLSTAVLQAYHTMLMVGRYPIAVVLLTFSQSSSMPPEQKLFAMALDGDKYKQTSFLDKTRLGAVDIKKCAAAGNGKFVCDVDSYSYTAQNGQTVARKKAEFTVSSGQLSEPKITE